VLHLVHSWSFKAPQKWNTIGGRWLQRGVYAYVGSVDEPFLAAFVPPKDLAARWCSFVPFLVAARHDEPNAGIWKVNLFGDPLMLCTPPPEEPAARLDLPAGYGRTLADRTKALLRACQDTEDGAAFTEAIEAAVLLGRDDIALNLWRLAEGRGLAPDAARPALGPLFRQRRAREFIDAWRALPTRTDPDADMLWHLLGPQLNAIDDDALMQLQAAIRRPLAFVDLRQLAGPLARSFGSAHVQALVERELQSAQWPMERRELQKLLFQY